MTGRVAGVSTNIKFENIKENPTEWENARKWMVSEFGFSHIPIYDVDLDAKKKIPKKSKTELVELDQWLEKKESEVIEEETEKPKEEQTEKPKEEQTEQPKEEQIENPQEQMEETEQPKEKQKRGRPKKTEQQQTEEQTEQPKEDQTEQPKEKKK